MTNTSPAGGRGLRTTPWCPPGCSQPALPLTLGMGPVGDAQGSRIGVRAVGNHPVEDVAAWWQPVTGQEPHNPWVTVVELGMDRRGQLSDGRSPRAHPPTRGTWGGGDSQAAWR